MINKKQPQKKTNVLMVYPYSSQTERNLIEKRSHIYNELIKVYLIVFVWVFS